MANQGNGYEHKDPARQTVRDEVITIDPMLLEFDEMQYELVLRSLNTGGRARDRTGRLRPQLLAEARNRTTPRESHMALPKDLDECQRKLNELVEILQRPAIDLDMIHRLATLCAHLEARIGRMYPHTPSQMERVREMRQQIEFLIGEYLTRLEQMALAATARPQPPNGAKPPDPMNTVANRESLLVDLTGGPRPNTIRESNPNAGAHRSATVSQRSANQFGEGAEANPAPVDRTYGGPNSNTVRASELPPPTAGLRDGRDRTDHVSYDILRPASAVPNQATTMMMPVPNTRPVVGDQDDFIGMRRANVSAMDPFDSAFFAERPTPTAAQWSGITTANTLANAQSGAQRGEQINGVDGVSFVRNFNQNVPRNVRFSDGSQPSRERVDREVPDTPYPRGQFPQQNPRYSDASNGSWFSGTSNFSDYMSRQVDTQSTRLPDQFARENEAQGVYPPLPRHPVPENGTYTIREGPRAPEGQWVYVPGNSDGYRDKQPSTLDYGEWVFIPYDEPNAWTTIINHVPPRRDEMRSHQIRPQYERDPPRSVCQSMPSQQPCPSSLPNRQPSVQPRPCHERGLTCVDQDRFTGREFPGAIANVDRSNGYSSMSSNYAACPSAVHTSQQAYPNMSRSCPHISQSGQSTMSHFPLRLKPLPVHLWKISFSGDDKPKEVTDLRVNEFLYQVEINKRAQRISDDEMLGQVSTLLNGTARIWYYAYFHSFTSWQAFVDAVRRRFLSPYHEQDAIDEISRRVQKRGEPALAYLNHMVVLFQTVAHGMDEGRLVHIIRLYGIAHSAT